MMKIRRLLMLLCIVLVVMCGCAQEKVNDEKKEAVTQKEEISGEDDKMMWRAITKEYLLEHFDISEEDLEGVDVESFLSTYDIDVDKIEKYDIPELLEFFVEEDAAQGMMSYEYMLNEPADGTLTSESVKDMVRIIWQKNEGDGSEALAFDFEKGKIYEGYRIDNFSNHNLIGIAEDTVKQKVIQIISEYDLYNWKEYYKGGSIEGTTASYNWQMAIEFSDGTLYQTGGDGMGAEAFPENMYEFIAALRACEPEKASASE